MTQESDTRPDHDARLPDGIRWQLRGMRAERMPARELWPDIADRLPVRAAAPASAGIRRDVRRHGWLPPAALAASLLLVAAVIGWRVPLDGATAVDAGTAMVRSDRAGGGLDSSPATMPARAHEREAAGLTRQYEAAFNALGTVPGDPNLQPVIAELDRSTDLILDALAQQPDSRLLLDQLRRTYAQRLALSQRMLNT